MSSKLCKMHVTILNFPNLMELLNILETNSAKIFKVKETPFLSNGDFCVITIKSNCMPHDYYVPEVEAHCFYHFLREHWKSSWAKPLDYVTFNFIVLTLDNTALKRKLTDTIFVRISFSLFLVLYSLKLKF